MTQWHDLFVYDAETGRLLWKFGKRGRGCIAGREAGTAAHHGYRAVAVAGKKHYVHRIAWEMVHGPIPLGLCVDHIDGDCSNNKLLNLRAATLSDNQRNRRLAKESKTGINGVTRHVRGGFSVRCANKYIGYSVDFFEACCIRMSAELQFGYIKRSPV